MSRIAYDTEHPGRLLMRTLAGYLTYAIRGVPCRSEDHLRNGRGGPFRHARSFLSTECLFDRANPLQIHHEIEMAEGKRTSTSLSQSGLRGLLPIHPRARVYGGPIISGHVGADAAACMLAVDFAH